MLDLLTRCFASGQQTPHAVMLRNEIEAMNKSDDALLLHDTLAEVNEPVYFARFMERAAANGLKFVGEAIPSTTAMEQFPTQVRAMIEDGTPGDGTHGDEILREQLIDVLRRRALRKAVLCRADGKVDRSSDRAEGTARELFVASAARSTGTPGEFVTPHRETFNVGDGSFVNELLKAVIAAWPQSVAVAHLASQADDPRTLCATLVSLMRTGLTDFDASPPPPCARMPGDRPLACPYARLQAAAGETVTHLRHDQVMVPARHREVLRLLDGTRTTSQLTAEYPDIASVLNDLAANALLVVPN
jgi:hypothetical protein